MTADWDLFSLPSGDLLKTHGLAQCEGNWCTMHNPSQHPLRGMPVIWRSDINLMMRVCNHGLVHPDPDDLAFKHRASGAAWAERCSMHQCDGCCPLGIMYKPRWKPNAWQRLRFLLGFDD